MISPSSPEDNTKTPDNYNILHRIYSPLDVKNIPQDSLPMLARDIRDMLLTCLSKTGGHLGAGLGVVELTIALHYVFNSPRDKIIFDVGHQGYPHKIITHRKDAMGSIRQKDGLSGFLKRTESEHDCFGAGHSSTSLSAGLGFAIARDLYLASHADQQDGYDYHVISVIGDGGMSAGMAFEAINNIGVLQPRMIIVLNDNGMSIAPATGALSVYLDKQDANDPSAGSLFKNMGLSYVGPLDGHDINQLINTFVAAKNGVYGKGSVLIHIKTQKGKGYEPAEKAKDCYHSVTPFVVETGLVKTGTSKQEGAGGPSYTKVFSQELCRIAKADNAVVAITAAMPSGTGLDEFAKAFPERFFDVGIAEQHAVTFAAGLAAQGFVKPFVAIYSTFLQRAYDQVIHDVVIQSLPVRFMIDRAGLVGADGPTHAGSFDVAYLSCLPNVVIMAPSNPQEMLDMMQTALLINDKPSFMRYPRANAYEGVPQWYTPSPLPIGRGVIVHRSEKNAYDGVRVAFLSLGTKLHECLEVAYTLERDPVRRISTIVANARFAKPIDTQLVYELLKESDILMVVEEGSSGGFASSISMLYAHYINNTSCTGNQDFCLLGCVTLPDCFIDHDHNLPSMHAAAGIDTVAIAAKVDILLRTVIMHQQETA